MLIEIDFNSNEAIYVQLQNQIIMGIATDAIREGDTLPSVRQLDLFSWTEEGEQWSPLMRIRHRPC